MANITFNVGVPAGTSESYKIWQSSDAYASNTGSANMTASATLTTTFQSITVDDSRYLYLEKVSDSGSLLMVWHKRSQWRDKAVPISTVIESGGNYVFDPDAGATGGTTGIFRVDAGNPDGGGAASSTDTSYTFKLTTDSAGGKEATAYGIYVSASSNTILSASATSGTPATVTFPATTEKSGADYAFLALKVYNEDTVPDSSYNVLSDTNFVSLLPTIATGSMSSGTGSLDETVPGSPGQVTLTFSSGTVSTTAPGYSRTHDYSPGYPDGTYATLSAIQLNTAGGGIAFNLSGSGVGNTGDFWASSVVNVDMGTPTDWRDVYQAYVTAITAQGSTGTGQLGAVTSSGTGSISTDATITITYASTAVALGGTTHGVSGYDNSNKPILRQNSGTGPFNDKVSGNIDTTAVNTYDFILSGSTLEGGGADTTAPTISSVAVSSATNSQNSTLNTGDVVSVTVTFDEAVTVNTSGGTPSIAISVGGVSRSAAYSSGTGTTAIVFTYTIATETADTDGISIGSDAISLNSGTIQDAAGNNATLTHSAVSANSSFKVDTTAPTISSVSVAADNSTATVTFSEDVYTNSNGTGDLTAADFSLGLSGGNAGSISLNATPSSISKTSQSVWVLTLNGTNLGSVPSGEETLIVDSASDTAVYDLGGTAHTVAASGVSLNARASSASKSITSSGGTVYATGSSVTIPSSALDSSTTIGINASESGSFSFDLAASIGDPTAEPYSPVVSLTPHGQTFSSAVTVTFDLVGSVAGTCPSNLSIYKRNSAEGTWYRLPSNLWSCSNGQISISTTTFSQYRAIGGSGMAETKLNPRQLEKLNLPNKALAKIMDLSGSAKHSAAIVDSDVFLMQRAGNVAKHVSASLMQDYFSKVDVTGSSDNATMELVFNEQNGLGLAVDTGLTFNPNSDLLTTPGSINAGGIVSGSGALQGSSVAVDLTIAAGGAITGASIDVSGEAEAGSLSIDAGSGTVAAITDAGAITGASIDVSGEAEAGSLSIDAGSGTVAGISGAGAITGASLDVAGTITGDTSLTLDSVTITTAEIGVLDSVTPGTAAASKALVLDASSNIGTINELTASAIRVDQLDVVTINSIQQTETTLEIADALILASSGSNSLQADAAGLQIGGTSGDAGVASVLYEHTGAKLELKIAGTAYARVDSGGLEAVGTLSSSAGLEGASVAVDGALTGASIDVSGEAEAGSLVIDAGSGEVLSVSSVGALSGSNTLRIKGASTFGSGAGKATIDANGAVSGSGAAQFASMHSDSVNIDGGAIDGTTIGADAQSSVKATTLSGSSTLRVKDTATFGTGNGKASISSAGAISSSAGLTIVGGSSFGPGGEATISAAGIISGSSFLDLPDGKLRLSGDTVDATAAELNKLDGALVTTAEINNIDADTSATSTTVEAADRVVFNDDDGGMKQVGMADLGTYFGSGNGLKVTSGVLSIESGKEQYYGSGSLTGSTLGGALTGLPANRCLALQHEPLDGSLQVYLNGLLQTVSASSGLGSNVFDYILSGTWNDTVGQLQVVFNAGVVDGDDAVVVHYIKKQ